MIKKIVVKNFQKHKHLVVYPSPTVTTIVGPNDAGKSAFIRALQWITLNKIRGSRFIRKGSKKATVSLVLDGHEISRSKGGANAYTLDGQRLAAFGSKIPDEVKQIVNLGDLNFQSQWDPVLWFNDSPGQVSRELNKIVDLEVIDSTLKKLGEMIRFTQAVDKVGHERLEKTLNEIQSLQPVKKAEKDLDRLTALWEELNQKSEVTIELARLVARARKTLTRIELLRSVSAAGQKALRIGGEWTDRTESLTLFSSLVRQAKTLKRSKAGVEIPAELERQARKLQRIRSHREELQELVEDAHKELWNSEHNELELALQKKELKQKFKECPLCEQKITS